MGLSELAAGQLLDDASFQAVLEQLVVLTLQPQADTPGHRERQRRAREHHDPRDPGDRVQRDLQLSQASGGFRVRLDDEHDIVAGAVIIASGVRYRRLDLPGLADLEGRGVYYAASDLEAKVVSG